MAHGSTDSSKTSNWAAWSISLVNGFWGDYLHDHGNGLAVEMALYAHNRPLTLTAERLVALHPQPSPKLCILVHGLSCNEHLWSFVPPQEADSQPEQVDYGTLLQAEFGCTPFYLRYNTGLSVAENGKSLAILLQTLCDCYPIKVEEMVLIGHSMGGLVLRSACHYARQHHESWAKRVTDIFYLGTPHDGADLERVAYSAAGALQAAPNSITRLVGKALNSRSRGIKNLRYGTLLEPDVIDEGWDDLAHHHHRAVPWLPHARHYLVGGTLNGNPAHIASVLFGDGLVAVPNNVNKAVPVEHIRLFPGIRHIQLAQRWEVYEQIAAWYRQGESK